VRTRFFDDLLSAETWAEQIVLLGAGMDTRAYRLGLNPNTVVFEIDDPAIFAAKNLVLRAVRPTCQRREVHADLAGEWQPALLAAGFDPARGTVWLAEGLLFYLAPASVGQVLRTSARASLARALFAADIFGTGLLRLPGMQPVIEHRRSSHTAPPFCTDQPGELLSAHGWRTDKVVQLGQPEANFGRIPTGASDRTPDPTMRTYLAIGARDHQGSRSLAL